MIILLCTTFMTNVFVVGPAAITMLRSVDIAKVPICAMQIKRKSIILIQYTVITRIFLDDSYCTPSYSYF